MSPQFPEPVSPSSQLAVLPFLAGVEGFLTQGQKDAKFRITMHRTIVREGSGYLQQLCTYLGPAGQDQSKVGRMFPVTEGIIGSAFDKRKIRRTKKYSNLADLQNDLKKDMRDTNDGRNINDVAKSFVAIPFLGLENQVVLILYAESYQLNFFADDKRIRNLLSMCMGFCRLFEWLETERGFPHLRNFPLQKGKPMEGAPTVYRRIQETVKLPVPRFQRLTSFNYESSAAR